MSVTLTKTLTNVSVRAASEVAQVYLHQRHRRASRPVRELKGFRRIEPDGGASQRVEFTLGPEHRRYWHAAERDWVVDDAVFDVHVGGDSTASLTATFEITTLGNHGPSTPP